MHARLAKQRDSTYTFSSQPKETQRPKFRQTVVTSLNESTTLGNLMYDRRVIRGNTYAIHNLSTYPQSNPVSVQRQEEAKRRVVARRRARGLFRTTSPEPMQDRKHIDVQTELYLEELSDRIEEVDVCVQTDRFLGRPSSPLFVPQSTGRDTATQIETGDLFHFDVEVKPIAEILVGKTAEQALIEVAEEEEITKIREQQRNFEELRNAELIELQRSEEQERRLRMEKEHRTQQAENAHRLEQEMAQKIAARAFTRAYLQDLVPSVFNNLRENGYFYDPVEHETEVSFMPWLMQRTMTEVNQMAISRTLLDSTIRDAINQRTDQYQRLDETLRQSSRSSAERSTPKPKSVHGSKKKIQGRESSSGDLRRETGDGTETSANN